MTRKFFGTDGVRGEANTPPITADIALRLAQAAGAIYRAAIDRGLGDDAVAGVAQRCGTGERAGADSA